ncbi:MAG: SDR family oxidoreductase, partial [Actinobacteria bacterium]|nr:SDR family oxidoreductase [Actinomycetota bacterium]
SCPSYTASKGATRAYFMDLANLEAPKGIRMNKIMPGVIITDMTKQITDPELKGTEFYEHFINMIPGRQFCPPEAIADGVFFLCSDEAAHIIGAELRIDDGFVNQC